MKALTHTLWKPGYQLPLISIMLIFVKNYIFKGETELGLIVMILIASFSLVLKN